MATLAASAFAAFAFAGAGEVMKYLDPSEVGDEISRHNRAVESLAKAKQKFYEEQVLWRKGKDEARARSISEEDARSEVDKSISDYRKAFDEAYPKFKFEYEGKNFSEEPKIEDFYKPSESFVSSSYILMGSIGVVSGLAGVLIYKKIRGRRKGK